jgi:hypothetical protein
MLKRTNNHTLYEVWNEWAAESVYVDHKPTKAEIQFLVSKVWGTIYRGNGKVLSLPEFIRQFVIVEKERHVYTATAKAKQAKYHAERGNDDQPRPCSYCNGSGTKSDDSYGQFKCPFCGGTGKQ